MNIKEISKVYFVGIGGIGMSALARFFKDRNALVSGYDKTKTELTTQLESEGIRIHYSDDPALLDKEVQLVVYTPAIPSDHIELNWYRQNGYPVYKRSDVLQWITESMVSVTVAGTHGKTTTSTLIAYLLRETGYGSNAFLGGISVNYERNYWKSDKELAVIEADEYDRSFLKLRPDIAVLTSMDPDHLDIYGTVEAMEAAFLEYTFNIKPGGTLLFKHGLKRSGELKGANKISYSLQNDQSDAYAENIVQKNGGYNFDLVTPWGRIEKLRLNIGGMHNVENAVAALTVAYMLTKDGDALREALDSFKGIKRRFEYVIRTENRVFIDDYAHHPEELAALIKSAKGLFPRKKCTVVFQPHLFSRTRDLAIGFAHSLDMADEIVLLDIYPARELPIDGVSTQMIVDKMENPAKTVLSKEGLLQFISVVKPELLITSGAGDIDQLVKPIKEILSES